MNIIESERLSLRRLTIDDAEFILGLLNQPSFLQFIGDKGVRTLDEARNYILQGPVSSYERYGFGLYLTSLKADGVPLGMCGLLQRENLNDVDVGFAFLPQFWGQGYALESVTAVLEYGQSVLGLARIVAITSPDNYASIKVLEKSGLRFAQTMRLTEDAPEVKLFVLDFGAKEAAH